MTRVPRTPTVTVTGPLNPGVTYDFWLVGHTQSGGEGPQITHVTHTVAVGP